MKSLDIGGELRTSSCSCVAEDVFPSSELLVMVSPPSWTSLDILIISILSKPVSEGKNFAPKNVASQEFTYLMQATAKLDHFLQTAHMIQVLRVIPPKEAIDFQKLHFM